MRTIICIFLACFLYLEATRAQEKFTISGYVREYGSGESMIGREKRRNMDESRPFLNEMRAG